MNRMTISKRFPLHHCIYRNDPKGLSDLLETTEAQKLINERDNHGNTPLHLALMLNRHNCVVILIKYNCDVFTRNNLGWNPMDEATMIGDIDVIDKISYRKWQEYVNALTKPGGFLDEWNKTTPYLYLKAKTRIRTSIPILKMFGARDIEKLYKKGKNIRFDTTVGGIDVRGLPKLIHKNISILYLYEESEKINKVYILDNTNKHYQEFFPNIPQWFLRNFLNSKIGVNTIYKYTPDLSKYSLKMEKGKIMKKNTRTFTMENGKSYKCDRYKGNDLTIIIKKRNDEGLIDTCKSIIKNELNEDDNKSTKSKERKRSLFIRTRTSRCSSTDMDESDFDSAIDSDDDSNFDNKTTKSNYFDSDDDYITIYNEDFGDGKNTLSKTTTYTINKSGKTETFEKAMSLEDTVDWEQLYLEKYAKSSDLVYSIINGRKDKTKLKNLTLAEIEKLKTKRLSEDEYFNLSSTDNLHMGRIMNITEERKKNNKIKFWMAKKDSNFPITAYDIKPMVKYFMTILLDQINSDEHALEKDKQAYDYITNEMLDYYYENDIFPVKISIPLYSTVAYDVTFVNVSKEKEDVPDDLFKIPSDYTPSDVFFEYIHK